MKLLLFNTRLKHAFPVLKFDRDLVAIDTHHGDPEVLAGLSELFGVFIMGDGLNHSMGPFFGVVALENAGPDETPINAQLHE